MTKNFGEQSLELHKTLHGKLETKSKVSVKTIQDLSVAYTPGVAAVSSYLAEHPEMLSEYSIKKNTVAVISDGSAVLGLGNIGPAGAMPVMEGKAVLFKEFANIDAFPIVLDTQDTEQIIQTVKNIAPGFGGINLEDISAPRCFEIETRLQEMLDIPVMHDDQHGTAIVVLAGLLNALKVAEKKFEEIRIVILGAGAAGSAIAELLLKNNAGDVLMLDRKGILSRGRDGMDDHKILMAEKTNKKNQTGDIAAAMTGADVLIGVSGPGILTAEHVKMMNEKSIVFAMANPIAEIMPDVAKAAGAFIVATGRSDYPNQINNVLGFPGIFRGALDHGVKKITQEMEIRAAHALAAVVKNPTTEYIIPSPFDPAVVPAVADAIR